MALRFLLSLIHWPMARTQVARGEIEADVGVAALAFDHVRDNFTDSLGLERSHRSRAAFGVR
jgi:hypothetical protein